MTAHPLGRIFGFDVSDPALRLLHAYLGSIDEPVVGGLPDDPKIDAPVIEGGEIVGSIVHRHPPMVTVYIDTTADPEEIVAFYEREYRGRGWRSQVPQEPRMGGGFGFTGFGSDTSPERNTRVFCKSEREPYYRLTIIEGEPRIHLSWHATSQGMFHPCSEQPADDRERMHGPAVGAMPTLQGPPNVPIRGGGGGGSSDEWSTYGSALTTMPASELMDHFVDSISGQGHELIERGAGDRVAWSRWRTKKEGWEGFLVVAEQRPDVRHLLFITFTEAAVENLRGWRSVSSGWSSRRFAG